MYIVPAICTDRDVCAPACPVPANLAESDMPVKWHSFIEKNAGFFK